MDNPPPLGVKVSYFTKVILFCEGRETLSSRRYNVSRVCELFIKPQTIEKRQSYCEYLKEHCPEAVGLSNVFISYSWSYNFLELLESIERYFIKEKNNNNDNNDNDDEVVVYLDLFSNNQHNNTTTPDFNLWSTTFQQSIKNIGRTVMILSPWNDPIPLTRAWCLWELYCTVITNSKFEIAMTNESKQQFIQDILNDPEGVLAKLWKIDFERSESTYQHDKDRIFSSIRGISGGFSKLNGLIFDELRDKVIELFCEEMTNSGKSDDPNYLNSIGELHSFQGNYEIAAPCNEKQVQLQRVSSGDGHPTTLNAIVKLAKTYMLQGDYSKALPLYEEIIQTRRENLGTVHPDTIHAVNKIALIHQNLGNFSIANEYYQNILELQLEKIGEENPLIVATLDGITKLKKKQEKFCDSDDDSDNNQDNNNSPRKRSPSKVKEAVGAAYDTLHIQMVSLGPEHLKTLETMNNIGKNLMRQDKLIEAEKLLSECLDLQLKHKDLGERHPSTIETRAHLARVYLKLGDNEAKCFEQSRIDDSNQNYINKSQDYYEKSKYHYDICYKLRKQVLGEKHRQTLASLNHLGMIAIRFKRYVEAKVIFEICVSYRKEVLVDNHVDINKTTNKLEDVKKKLNNINDDILLEELNYHEEMIQIELTNIQHEQQLVQEYNDSNTSLLGAVRISLLVKYYLALLKFKQNNFSEAKNYLDNCLREQVKRFGADHSDTIQSLILLEEVRQRIPAG